MEPSIIQTQSLLALAYILHNILILKVSNVENGAEMKEHFKFIEFKDVFGRPLRKSTRQVDRSP